MAEQYPYKFKKGDRVELTKPMDWSNAITPVVGDIGTVIRSGIVTTRVGFSLRRGIFAISTRKLRKVTP